MWCSDTWLCITNSIIFFSKTSFFLLIIFNKISNSILYYEITIIKLHNFHKRKTHTALLLCLSMSLETTCFLNFSKAKTSRFSKIRYSFCRSLSHSRLSRQNNSKHKLYPITSLAAGLSVLLCMYTSVSYFYYWTSHISLYDISLLVDIYSAVSIHR